MAAEDASLWDCGADWPAAKRIANQITNRLQVNNQVNNPPHIRNRT